MKLRVIRKPEFMVLCYLQVKRWWFPFWVTVLADDEKACMKLAAEILKHGQFHTLIAEMET